MSQWKNKNIFKILIITLTIKVILVASTADTKTSNDDTDESKEIENSNNVKFIKTAANNDSEKVDLDTEETRSYHGVSFGSRQSFGSSPYSGFLNSRIIHKVPPQILRPVYKISKSKVTPAFTFPDFIFSNKQNKPIKPPPGQCGAYLTRPCQQSRYRTFDGSCNNLPNPTWGMANTKYARLLPANYADNVHEPPVSVSGAPLPLSREVSYILFPHAVIPDKKWTLAAMQYGQIITHDMAMIDGTTQSKAHATRCCTDEGQIIQSALSSPLCFPIIIPSHDPVYGRTGRTCHNFVRSTTTLDRGCTSKFQAAEQLTVVSSFLDASLVYGATDDVAASLRAGVGGRLNVDIRTNREWLPAATNKSAACDLDHEAQVCYMAGDVRVNQNPQLTILQVLLHREHNRIAGELSRLNPHWSDETTYQEARRILTAEHQHISYYEWLPIFIGMENSYRHKILYKTKGYVNDYDSGVDPSVINEHSTAAFRYFHSLIAGRLQLVNEMRYSYSFASLRLSDHFNKPEVIEQNGNFDHLTRGMGTQPQEMSDQYFDKEITRYLFRNNRPLGDDLRAIDIQRNRDHGLATYNSFREYCGIPRAKRWSDFADYISPDNIQRLATLYESPDDVDLTVGASLEAHIDGTLAGPTFLCILTEQFYRTRVGDRFWYETGDPSIAFTIEQLNEIRKSSISRIFCDNGDNIQLMQPRGFEVISGSNPLMRCSDLPAIDLSFWKDYANEVNPLESSEYSSFNFYKK